MKCIWCESETTTDKSLSNEKIKYANKEHIFPEAVGGKKCLSIGKVCQACNTRLGNDVDKYLKTENFMMLKQYQDSSEIIGKPIGKIDKSKKERKKNEMFNISGYGGGFKIERNPEDSGLIRMTNLINGTGGDYTFNEKFSKALHKCLVNVLLDKYDYDFIKSNYQELINFVNDKNNADYQSWSYGVCYANLFEKIHFEPFCLQIILKAKTPIAIVLIFPSAIYLVGAKPNSVTPGLLKFFGSNPPRIKTKEDVDFDYISRYTNSFADGYRNSFGDKLKFTLIKQEIKGTANPDDTFYLLTKCKTCGQTNPTFIMLGKELIFKGNLNHRTSGRKNTWNIISVSDLKSMGYQIENMDSSSLQDLLNQVVSYPIENDVTKLNIKNCQVLCINCNDCIEYDATDCFL